MAQALHGSVLDDLGIRIAGGNIPAGTVLTLAQIEQSYSASRTVIREAVRVLEALGMVASRRRVGVTVQPQSEWSNLNGQLISWRFQGPARGPQIVALTELRLAIEPIAAQLMALRADASERNELLRLAEVLETLGLRGEGDTDAYLDADIAFHNLILDASRNPMFASIKEPIALMLSGRHQHGLTPGSPHDRALDNHVAAARAIAIADAEAAEAAARRFVTAILDEVRVYG